MTYDDEHIGRLVRDVADDWTMPPVRLDQPTWRDRLPERRPRWRLLRPSMRPLVRASGLAVVLLVVAAIAVVALHTVPQQPGGSPGNSTNSAIGRPQPTPLQTATTATQRPATEGTLPSVTSTLMQVNEGSFSVLDLAHGTLRAPFATGSYGSAARRAADGSLYCLCAIGYHPLYGQLTSVGVYLAKADASGAPGESVLVATYVGAPDPRDSSGGVMLPPHVEAAMSFGPDQRHAYVGWSERQHPVWQSGIDVVDVATHQVVGTLDLPAVTDGEGDTRRVTDAPKIVGFGKDQAIVARTFYTWSPASSLDPVVTPGVDVFTVALGGASIIPTSPKPLDGAAGCGDAVVAAGVADDHRIWLACTSGGQLATLRRLAADGSLAGDTTATTFSETSDSTVVASADGTHVYVWHPVDRRLTRIDTSTGAADEVQAPAESSVVAPDLARQIADWFVPPTSAKVFLSGAIALAPDGQTLYALGVGQPNSRGSSGSTGVYAVHLGPALRVEHWPAQADLVSLAVSADGRYVLTAGMPGVDATGTADAQPASVSVYDAATGSVTYSAGQLGDSMITFAGPIAN